MIVLKQISIQNFMSIRKVDLDLEDRGLLLIRGENRDDSSFDSNGAGKSSLFEALTFVIFDKSIRGLSGDELVNNEVKKNALVTLEFTVDHDTYLIKRYRKHIEFKNNVYLYKNKVNITGKSNKETNKMIEDIFKMDYKTFTNAVLFGSGAIKTFSTASDKEKKEILESMLNLGVWGKAQERAKERLKEVKEQIQEEEFKGRENERSKLETTNSIKELEDMKKVQQGVYENQIAEYEEEIQQAIEEQNNLNKRLHDMDVEHTKTCFIETDKEMELSTLEKDLEGLQAYSEAHKGIVDNLTKVSTNIQILTRELQAEVTKEKELKAEVLDIAHDKETCPYCNGEFIAQTGQSRLDTIKEKLKECVAQKKRLVIMINELQGKEDNLKKKSEEYKLVADKIADLKDKRLILMTDIKDLQGQRGLLKQAMDNLLQQENKVEHLQAKLEEFKKAGVNSDLDALILCKAQTLDELDKVGDTIQERIKELKDEQSKLEFAVDSFSNAGIKSYLLDGITPMLNERANKYLKKLSGGTTEIKFTTQTRLANGEVRDKFNVEIFNSIGGDNYKSNSAGERRRIDLAISLALQDLALTQSSGSINILLFDEIFDALDSTGVENVIELLKETEKRVGTIFVISHNESLKTLFDKELTVIKENGQTTVESG